MALMWFLIVGTLGIVALVVVSFLKWRWWWQGILALILTGVVVLLLDYRGTTYLGNKQWFDTSPYRELLLFALMLFGMAARVLSLAIEQQRAGKKGSGKLEVSRWDFVYPMLFAVPTFGALLSQIGYDSLTLSNAILSFQTGFFYQTILRRGHPS
ncbi:MAG: hypothetical protein NTW68_02265 [candidate division NC10 bacterium]|nr:hypothetical protein [candidate division NC10 bacterium]